MDGFGLTAREQLTCGFHVHVCVGSDQERAAVLDRIRIWLPVLAALSANSPFWNGEDTGYGSYRTQAWGRWPTLGPAELFGSDAGYRSLVSGLSRWDDACMSENTQRGTAPGGEEDHAQGPDKEHPRRPSTQPIRTVGQRRRDSEEKLETHQRGARTKPPD